MNPLLLYENYFRKLYGEGETDKVSTQLLTILFQAGK